MTFIYNIFISYLFIFSLYSSSATYSSLVSMNALNISQASYCISNNIWNCATCQSDIQLLEMIEEGGVRVITTLNNKTNEFAIGFRGSSNVKNWIDNIQFSQVNPYINFPDVAVDKGFYKAFGQIRERLIQNINQIYKLNPEISFLITGHSLGGALATLTVFELIYIYDMDPKIFSIITFGSPRVGNDIFKKHLMIHMAKSWRVTHYYDIVPHVPEEFMNYIHISQEIWYNRENTNYTTCNDDIEEDDSCSNSCAPVKCTSIDDHMYYMNISMGKEGTC